MTFIESIYRKMINTVSLYIEFYLKHFFIFTVCNETVNIVY